MSITHQAYLFNVDDFVEAILPFANALEQNITNEHLLYKHVVQRYSDNPRMRELAMEYGAWDVQSLYDDVERSKQGSSPGPSWWLLYMIYDHVRPEHPELTLDLWWLMEKVLAKFGWHTSDIACLVHGHSFGYLAQLKIADNIAGDKGRKPDVQYWETVRPGSTVAQIGWLDYADAARFLKNLIKDEHRLADVDGDALGLPAIDNNAIRQTYESALHILGYALEARSGLCLVTSG